MKATDVVRNIQFARSEIEKLKEQMSLLSANPDNMNNYTSVMNYSISKFQASVDKTIARLPIIKSLRSQSRASVRRIEEQTGEGSKAYKKLRRYVKGNEKMTDRGHQRHRSMSKDQTRDSSNLSLSIINKPMRILSFVQKHVRVQYQTDMRPVNFRLDISQAPKEIDPTQFLPQRQEQTVKFYNMMLETTNRKQQQQQNELVSLPSVGLPLEYKQSVDRYSLHQFMVRKGRVISDTPEFASYRRIYESIWKKLKFLFQKLEEILNKYKIELAYVDGKRLAVLALKNTYTTEDLINCMVDNQKFLHLIIPKSPFIGVQGKLRAIIVIQKFWRMHTIQRQYKHFRVCVVKLQTFMKKFVNKLRTRRQIHQKNEQLYQNFVKSQKKLTEQYKSIVDEPHFELHVNSFSVDQMKRLTISNYIEKKNLQLSRIFRLRDPNLMIIMVLPSDLPAEVINYYYKVMELAGIQNFRDRLFFVLPQAVKIFPEHMSTSKLLYYSPKCLAKINKIIKGRPCFMISGYPCNETIKIAQFLKVHLLSGDPQKSKYFSTKSQCRRLFISSDLPVAPGAIELYDISQLINTFAVLIANNRQVQTWVLKIDDEFSSRGIATINIGKIRAIKRLLQKYPKEEQDENQNVQFFQTVPLEEQADFQEQLTSQIKTILTAELPKRLHICTPQLYHNYQEFMGRMVDKGGCIQAYPALKKQDIRNCSVSFFSSPAGDVDIICSYEKLQVQMVTIGCSFPQQCLPSSTIFKCCKSISQALNLRGLFGFFTIDLLAFKQMKQTTYRYWAIGLDCYLNTLTCTFFYFNVLMSGKYLTEYNTYLVEEAVVSERNYKDLPSSEHSVDTMVTYERPIKQRRYLALPYIHHQHLNTIKMKTFFKMARLEGVSYDLKEKKGICMMLVDQLSSGVLGLLSVQENHQNSIEEMYKTLSFISKLTKKPGVYGASEMNSRTDEVQFRDIMSKLNSLRRRLHRQNFQQEAYKKNLINCNLQPIV